MGGGGGCRKDNTPEEKMSRVDHCKAMATGYLTSGWHIGQLKWKQLTTYASQLKSSSSHTSVPKIQVFSTEGEENLKERQCQGSGRVVTVKFLCLEM